MSTEGVNFAIAWLAGVTAFLAPCFWPVLPVFLSMISGMSISQLSQEQTFHDRRRIVLNSLIFICGFGVIFFLLGLTASAVGQFLRQWRQILERLGGLFLIILGAYFLEWFKISWLYRSWGFRINHLTKRSQAVNIFLSGATLALGWTPCIGPVLATILVWTGVFSTDLWQGAWWLVGFTLGLGTPFLILALLFAKIYPWWKKQQTGLFLFHRLAGWLIVIFGLLLLLGWWHQAMAWLVAIFHYHPWF